LDRQGSRAPSPQGVVPRVSRRHREQKLEVRRFYANFTYQSGSLTKSRRAVAKVGWNSGELYPRVGFIMTDMIGSPRMS
jgi:hypothetical protein